VKNIINHLSNGCSFSTSKAFMNCHQKLGEHLNLPTITLAKGGRGNDRMVTTTMHWFYNNPGRFKDTFVTIGWSSGQRWDYIHGKTDYDRMKGVKRTNEIGKFSYQWGTWRLWENEWIARDKDIDIEMAATVRLYTNILTLQDFFKLHNIPYLMYWALSNELHDDGDLKNLKGAVDTDRFYNFETSEHVKENIKIYNEMKTKNETVTVPNTDYVQSHFEYCAQQGLRKSFNDAHPSQKGHHQWADLLLQFIHDKKIL